MTDRKLRQAIAAEAARLLYQGKEAHYHSARRKAARFYSRQRVSSADMPSFGEIQQEIQTRAGLFQAERQASALVEIRLAARDLMELLAPFEPRLQGIALTGPVLPGADLELLVGQGTLSQVTATLFEAGHRPELRNDGRLAFHHCYPCLVTIASEGEINLNPSADLEDLDRLLAEPPIAEPDRGDAAEGSDVALDQCPEESGEEAEEESYHPDFFPTVRLLLNSLEAVRLDPDKHPEGDLLYHTLQVYELGLAERPYDEEFLLACLLHDVGRAIDRRHAMDATWRAIGSLVTPRTWFLIESLPEAAEYLSTGRIRGALRRSEDFEDLVLLAQCDLKGRVRGAQVSQVDEAVDYVASLGSAWEDV